MAIWSISSCSDVVSADRADADFHKPEYLELDSTLDGTETCNLGRLAFSVRKGIFDISPNRYREDGVPLIRTFQI